MTMHADEVPINTALIRRLLETQFPAWAQERIAKVPSAGTDNALYRLGGDRVVRLPRIASAALQLEKEAHWLPFLAPQLPYPIPVPLGSGQPDAEYPFNWVIYRWLEGNNPADEHGNDPALARDLAAFIGALQQIDATDAPAPGAHNFGRGVPLHERDAATRDAIFSLSGDIDSDAALALWQRALNATPHQGQPVWIHGDLQAGNILIHDKRLSAVIDFGGLAAGDPACDLQIAWNLLTPETRQVFRDALQVDDAAWLRGQGWALSVAVIALPYYRTTNPTLAGIARRTLAALLT